MRRIEKVIDVAAQLLMSDRAIGERRLSTKDAADLAQTLVTQCEYRHAIDLDEHSASRSRMAWGGDDSGR